MFEVKKKDLMAAAKSVIHRILVRRQKIWLAAVREEAGKPKHVWRGYWFVRQPRTIYDAMVAAKANNYHCKGRILPTWQVMCDNHLNELRELVRACLATNQTVISVSARHAAMVAVYLDAKREGK
ncbi:MAG: hypothetical protein JEZ11_03735 [Desulfobacterales bacterium]|nr:hypothetical protein [Desulfobacterales bacterium]